MSDKILKALTLPVLGVVYGDIGTSPLYTFRECLAAAGSATEIVILGILSLIFWTLMIITTIKYILFIMQADNQGEGGIIALLALALQTEQKSSHRRTVLLYIGLSGAALFYGDSIITPAISVLSAVEGLTLATPIFQPYVLPLTLIILILLFTMQYRGTQKVGQIFGPIMMVWFLTLGGMGFIKILTHPSVLLALNPFYALTFLQTHGYQSLPVLGAVVLAITGVEALYADMGHFGISPIRRWWFYLVFPALTLNYFGQGATVLMNPAAAKNPFFIMFPESALIPLIILATATTVIASQAVISGTYSMTQQIVMMGYLPRFKVLHTSASESGQIYIPLINWLLCAIIILVVLAFGSSSRLAAAYGIAVTGTMLMTTLLFYVVARQWGWRLSYIVPLVSLFLLIDTTFLSACLLKVIEGGWLPLSIALILSIFMSTWRQGNVLLSQTLKQLALPPLVDVITDAVAQIPQRLNGTAVYLAKPKEDAPPTLLNNLRYNKILHEKIIIVSIEISKTPHSPNEYRYQIESLGMGFYHIRAQYGFMDQPHIPQILEACKDQGLLNFEHNALAYFVGPYFVDHRISLSPGMIFWRAKLFAIMQRHAAPKTDFFQIPAKQVIEINIEASHMK